MKTVKLTQALLAATCLSAGAIYADTQVEPEHALHMLHTQDAQFEKQIIQVADNVYTAVGYHGANTSMIVGNDGVIIVDTLMSPTSANEAMQAFREYSDKPVKAILYTHSHSDHIGGASGFVSDTTPAIYATEGFGSAEGVNKVVDPVKMKRNIRQFGRDLTGEEVTNRGVAPANTTDHDRMQGFLPPTIRIEEDGTQVTIAGIELELFFAPGETDDAMFIWLPKEKVLFTGDNFYSSFPNLYAIRGTAYRDVLKWSESVAKMAAFEPDYVVPGHTMPILDKAIATTALSHYSEAIRSIYDQTVVGINAGKSPELIAHEVHLPAHLQDKPYLIEFYGTVPHAVRAIYAGLLGWFDGNPTTLNPLAPKVQAEKIAQLAGGTNALAKQMNAALSAEDYQWALQLADHVKWLQGADRPQARQVKIQALRALAAKEYNAPNRNYYLSYANELESGQLSEVWF